MGNSFLYIISRLLDIVFIPRNVTITCFLVTINLNVWCVIPVNFKDILTGTVQGFAGVRDRTFSNNGFSKMSHFNMSTFGLKPHFKGCGFYNGFATICVNQQANQAINQTKTKKQKNKNDLKSFSYE